MFEYRVTKYDPAVRQAKGTYAEWTSVSHIGTVFNGKVLSQAAYEGVETAYIAVALAFLREVGVSSVQIRGLENHNHVSFSHEEGDFLALTDALELMTRILREEIWCRLESSEAFVHFGYDYYMYVGVSSACPKSERLAADAGLFVELMPSPYHPETE